MTEDRRDDEPQAVFVGDDVNVDVEADVDADAEVSDEGQVGSRDDEPVEGEGDGDG